ncbi:hypothetical protein [Marinobacter sp.]|uniref:hypothetical protein n=1 Tax=Marinobacter sp. TaxID=50741 RepID=UPI00384F2711
MTLNERETALNIYGVDDLSLGCALAIKEQWSFGGRYPLMQSQLGHQAAMRMIDQQCGSSLTALRFSIMSIGCGAADTTINLDG